jgi:hypothetical protein
VVSRPPAPDPASLRRDLHEMELLAREGRRGELAALMRRAGGRVVRVPSVAEEVS